MREVSLEEISAATRISVRLLRALEESDVTRLPAPVFTRGFIRAYAVHLGLDPEEMVNAYRADLAPKPAREAPGPKKARTSSRFWRGGPRATAGMIVATVSGVLLLLGLIASPERRTRPIRTEPARALAPVAFKNVTVSSEPAPAIRDERAEAPVRSLSRSGSEAGQASSVSLLLECDQSSWAEIVADGERVFAGLMRSGEARRFEAREGFRLTLGNAGGVRVTVDGHALEPLGRPGQVVRNLSLPEAST
jgi:cytoskeletal protein RodZ